MGQIVGILDEALMEDDNLPPLIELPPSSQPSSQQNSLAKIIRHKETPVYPKAGIINFLKKDKKMKKKDKVPPLLETDPEKPKIPEPKPITSHSLICKGETISISEDTLKKIPYLETLLSGRFSTEKNEDGLIEIKEDFNTDLLKIIVRSLEEDERYLLLASLKKDEDPMELFELYRYLAVKPPINTDKKSLQTRLSEMPSLGVICQNNLIDLAFAVYYAAVEFKWKSYNSLRNKIYNSVFYVLKNREHAQSFKPRAKHHFRQIALQCIPFTENQVSKIKEFSINDNLDESDDESDHEDTNYYDSNDFFSNSDYEMFGGVDPYFLHEFGYYTNFFDDNGFYGGYHSECECGTCHW